MPRRKPTESAELKLRLRESLRAAIEKSARKRGRSLNQELIDRLEGSFNEEDRLGGPQLVELVETIARTMKSAGETAGFAEAHGPVNQGQWLAFPYARDQAIRAAIAILEHHRPPADQIVVPKWDTAEVVGGDPKHTEEAHRQLFENLGELFASKELRDLEETK